MTSDPHPAPERSVAWWRLLNRYHWYVFTLAAFGWLFDTMDQQIFVASKALTMKEFFPAADLSIQTKYGAWATTIFILGWATGGLIFGMMGDKWGRAKTMAVTIFVYAFFTGFSGLTHTWETFAICRFLTGLGVGGEFAVGAALVAEVMPDLARPHALGMLQALSAVGNIIGASLLGLIASRPEWGWRGLYYVGALPALLAVFVFWRLKEPEKWVTARALANKRGGAAQFGRISELFQHPVLRRNTIVGLVLAIAGVIGVWGVAFWSPELIDSAIPTMAPNTRVVLDRALVEQNLEARARLLGELSTADKRNYFKLQKTALGPRASKDENSALTRQLTPAEQQQISTVLAKSLPETEKTKLKSRALILQQIGAFLGIWCFTLLAARVGRRASFLISFIVAWLCVLLTFFTFQTASQIWYLWPILGFGTLAPFGGFAIYLPELFPTRLRTTGTGFCYNVGRYLSAFGPLFLGQLGVALDGKFEIPGFRLAAMIVASAYFLGMLILIWAPETLNKPLMED